MSRRTVSFARRASLDLDAIHMFWEEQSPELAADLLDRLERQCLALGEFPGRGRRVNRRSFEGQQVRRLLVYPYYVFYGVGADEVTILRIWHSARLSPGKLDLLG